MKLQHKRRICGLYFYLNTNIYHQIESGCKSPEYRFCIKKHQLEILYIFNRPKITGLIVIGHRTGVVKEGSVLMD